MLPPIVTKAPPTYTTTYCSNPYLRVTLFVVGVLALVLGPLYFKGIPRLCLMIGGGISFALFLINACFMFPKSFRINKVRELYVVRDKLGNELLGAVDRGKARVMHTEYQPGVLEEGYALDFKKKNTGNPPIFVYLQPIEEQGPIGKTVRWLMHTISPDPSERQRMQALFDAAVSRVAGGDPIPFLWSILGGMSREYELVPIN